MRSRLQGRREEHNGSNPVSRHRPADRLRRLADPASPHLPGDHWPFAALVCGQPVHFLDGGTAHRRGADSGTGYGGRSGAARRSASAGTGSHRHRHQLRDYCTLPRRASGSPRPDRNRPRRRPRDRPMNSWLDHLAIAPIVIPLLTGAAMVVVGERRRMIEAALGVASTLLLLAVSIALLRMADSTDQAMLRVYRLGDWPVTFGIVLVVDRLAALMVLLTSILGFSALIFSLARWYRKGAHFQPLFQFQLMGLNGAFLTGDLFNLFVFFEVLLAASYGLALHGPVVARVKAGLHYIAVNLTASLLFLVGVSMIYGIAGTLNMADLAARIPAIPAEDRALLEAGAAILGVAFLIKAAMWPLGFWLPNTYSAASAPVAAILSILSKVG